MHKYIISDPKILSGIPVVKGTRVPVARILSLLKEGNTIIEIQKQFDHINLKTLTKVLDEITANYNNSSYDTQAL